MFKRTLFVLLSLQFLLLSGCAGKINTIKYINQPIEYKKVIIISAENSRYIDVNIGSIMVSPAVYVNMVEDTTIKHKAIGNIDEVIKKELEKYGIYADIIKKGEVFRDFDLRIQYTDVWQWDFEKILANLEIIFVSPEGVIIAKSTYKMAELHNFPKPEKVVPKMIKELLGK